MIGVLAHPQQRPFVEEFFELFKTPWEFLEAGRVYDAVLTTTGELPEPDTAKVIVAYGVEEYAWDGKFKFVLGSETRNSAVLLHEEVPTYCGSRTVRHATRQADQESVAKATFGDSAVYRIGYNLFEETKFLLGQGQPEDNALIPALDIHIDILRQLLLRSGLLVAEIPPVPPGYRFIGCLTHDIDFVSLRQHFCDRTMAGFLYRATVGSLVDLIRGHRRFSNVLRNFWAVLKVPFVHLRLASDFWLPFNEYLRVEGGRPSTFFIIPFKGTPGKALTSSDNRVRAVAYDISDVTRWMPFVCERGGEIALHGIDAWHDAAKARTEADRIEQWATDRPSGVRMHWLYFSESSAEILDSAGLSYDSTCGYNSAVGYRAGTGQVFKPVNAENLLELPMHIQDTALFYPGRMHLREGVAWTVCQQLVQNAERNGGVLTLLWHDRSLAPERLWGEFYVRLISDMDAKGVWWGTARQVTEWFRNRRAISFQSEGLTGDETHIEFADVPERCAPDLQVRFSWMENGVSNHTEIPLQGRKVIIFNRKSSKKLSVGRDLESTSETALAV